MATTVVRGGQIKDASIQRADIDVSTVGQSLIAKAVQGRGVKFTSTGGDAGTGDVTIDADPSTTSNASLTTWAPNADTDDVYAITAQAAAVTAINNPTGSPVDGQNLIIRYKDNGTARALAWTGTQWEAAPGRALPTTTVVGATDALAFIWNATTSKWTLSNSSRVGPYATLQTSSASPTGTTSGTGVMCGLAGLITPTQSGKIVVTINGALNNNTAGGGAQAQIRWGTGSAPANGAALTGTAVGVNAQRAGAAWGSNQTTAYSITAIISGLTIGTQIWIDIGQSAVVGGTMNLTASITAAETP
jgi:hypothetical protein